MRPVALVVVLAGCSAPVCSLDNAIVELGRPAKSCGDLTGTFAMTADPAPYNAAHDCLVAAIAAHEPVIATWYASGIDSASEGAWVGIDRSGDYEVFMINGGIDGEIADTITMTRRCLIIGDEGSCADYATGLCLACGTGPSEARLWHERSVLAAIALLAACNDGACELDPSIDRTVGLPSHDCGTLDFASTADAFRMAHDCAMTAVAAHVPFIVTAPTLETTEALVGTGSGAGYRVDDFVLGSVARTCTSHSWSKSPR